MNEQLQALGAFIFVLVALALGQRVEAAMSLTPAVAGYSAGSFASASGTFTTAANGASYGASGIVNVGGKSVTVPATLRMAANAGQYAKSAMRLNPWGIAATLAAGWLLDQGLEYLTPSGWMYSPTPTAEHRATCDEWIGGNSNIHEVSCLAAPSAGNTRLTYYLESQGPGYTQYVDMPTLNLPARPATDADWAGLPDPIPVIAPELPFVPYVDGAPVDAPEYDFAPFSVPVGEPYSKPDGATAQPMARVSPAGDTVTVDTYEQPLTDANGDPVPNAPPTDTAEPTPSECEQHPATIGCAEFGSIPAPDALPSMVLPATATVVPVGGAGACPADVVTSKFGITWSYQPICNFADAVRPFIVGFAWLAFAYIVAGAVRT